MWIFGYGSLVWKADFPYIKKVVGYVKGYERKFWQASIDHRGVPGKPGRVVTLVVSSDPEAKVWGVAYEINDSETESIEALNLREKRYEQSQVLFYPVEENTIESGNGNSNADQGSNVNDSREMPYPVNIYIGALDSPLFLGDAPVEQIALEIAHAEGPSGCNRDYVFQLAQFMKAELPNASDPHLFDIERALRKIISHSEDESISSPTAT